MNWIIVLLVSISIILIGSGILVNYKIKPIKVVDVIKKPNRKEHDIKDCALIIDLTSKYQPISDILFKVIAQDNKGNILEEVIPRINKSFTTIGTGPNCAFVLSVFFDKIKTHEIYTKLTLEYEIPKKHKGLIDISYGKSEDNSAVYL